MQTSVKTYQAQPRLIYLTTSIGILAIGLVCPSRVADAQGVSTPPSASTEPKLPVYDVVSIKPNKSGSFSEDSETSRYRYVAKNLPIRALIERAYGIKKPLISGISGPLDSARFDVEAKMLDPDPAAMKALTGPQRSAMLRPVLTERFKLTVHTEIKTLPTYDLVVLKGGPKFQESPKNSQASQGTSVQNTVLEAHGVSMVNFAVTLSSRVQRTVIDKTGLTGVYELELKWSRDDGDKQDDGTADPAPPIFTALQEQLGLKLVPAKGPVETLVVDHVELPSEN